MDVLTLLEEYSAAHEAAGAEFGSAQWSLTLARRAAASRSPSLTVATPLEASSLVRYELEPQTVVSVTKLPELRDEDDDDEEPDLIVATKEGGTTATKTKSAGQRTTSSNADAATASGSAPQRYSMVNVMEEREKHKENAQHKADSLTSSSVTNSNSTDGLRQRKGGMIMDNKKNAAAAHTKKTANTTTSTMVEELDESGQTPNNDPVLLLAGMLPPRELRVAQQKATAALQKYIHVANLLVELQTKMQDLAPEPNGATAAATRTTIE